MVKNDVLGKNSLLKAKNLTDRVLFWFSPP